jgi:peptidoglycan/xylan/chitin deacetylase (PgdA/CDA1 family)
MHFCIRDDDTSFFTSPHELERAYGEISQRGPVSLAIVPFCRAGLSKGVPTTERKRWSIHPLHENTALVDYLRQGIHDGRFEAMLHGYHHDEPDGVAEFVGARDLRRKVAEGRRYLEDVLGTAVRVFVPPHNAIGPRGLRAIAAEGLHLAGTAGIRAGWSLRSRKTWGTWIRLRRWHMAGGLGIPWVLDLEDHREIPSVCITPASRFHQNQATLDSALARDAVFCAATHYWEFDTPSVHAGDCTVGEQLRRLVNRAADNPRVVWRTVGAIVSDRSVGL